MSFLIANVTLPAAGDMVAFSPELIGIATVVLTLLLPLFLPKRRLGLLTAAITVAGAGAAAGMALFVYCRVYDNPDLVSRGQAFSGLLVADGLSCFLRMLIYGFLALIAIMWRVTAARGRSHARPGTDDDSADNPPEFFVLLISAAIGMALMVSTRNLLTVIVAVELASLPSYVMAGFQKRSRLGAEAALKYVVFGAASAAIMIYGVSLLYGCYGTLDAGEIGRQVASGRLPLAAGIGLLGLLAGVGFKVSAVPFHFWCPDVFEGASVVVAAFLSVASKAAGLTLLIRLALTIGQFDAAVDAVTGQAGPVPHSAWTIALIIGILASITATVGNLAALAQDNLKRLLAYSSIAHAGYMLMAGAILSRDPATARYLGAEAVMLYLVVYLFMNLGAFSVVAIVANRTGGEGSGGDESRAVLGPDIRSFAGLGRRSPVLAVSMALFMVSLVGLPPMAGFAAKFQLFAALFFYKPYPLGWLVVVGLVNTLISLVYYMRVVKAMFLESSEAPPLVVGPAAVAWVVGLAIPVTLLLAVWQPLSQAAAYFGRLLMFKS